MKTFHWLRFLAIALLIFPVAACQRQAEPPAAATPPITQSQPVAEAAPAPPADPANPCNTGPDNNPNQPILCIDDTAFPTITVDPAPNVSVNLNPSRTVHWFTKSGTGTIGIVYDSDLLDAPDMKPGKGHTKAKAGSQTGSVKYSIVVMKGTATSNVIDPTIIIDTNVAP